MSSKKTYQVSEEFLIEALNSAEGEVRERLLQEFPEFADALPVEISNIHVGTRTEFESNEQRLPFFVGKGVVGPKFYRDRCIVPCEGYTVELVDNVGGSADFPTLVVFTKKIK